jgi:hypothetical protein
MGVVPVQAGRLSLGNLKPVLERRVTGIDDGLKRLILVADGRNRQSVEV